MKSFIQYITEEFKKYVYHGTDSGNLDSIKQHGLRPSEFGNPLNFHDDHEAVKYYSGPNGVIFRLPKHKLPKDTKYDSWAHHHWTKTAVPAHHLEMKSAVGGKWKKFSPK